MQQFMVSLAAAYTCAVAAGILLCRTRRFTLLTTIGGVSAVILCLLLIPADRPGYRAIASLFCVDICLKLVNFSSRRHITRCTAAGSRDYLRFLVPFPPLVVLYDQKRRVPTECPVWPEACRCLVGATLFGMAFVLIDVAAGYAAIRSHFLLDHFVKLLIFVLAAESFSQALLGAERLAGYETTPIVRCAFLSKSVAEFWRRYNTRVHAWITKHVFLAYGGRRAPSRGVWLAFLFSALLHELFFGIATSRLDGYQFAFFLLQAPAVLASPTLERFARNSRLWGRAVAHSLTVLWFASTSILFFHGADRVFPFLYASDPWLP